MEESHIYLEGLPVAAARAQLLDDASEMNVLEVVSGPRRPNFDLRHKECARFAQRPQRGLQVRRRAGGVPSSALLLRDEESTTREGGTGRSPSRRPRLSRRRAAAKREDQAMANACGGWRCGGH